MNLINKKKINFSIKLHIALSYAKKSHIYAFIIILIYLLF